MFFSPVKKLFTEKLTKLSGEDIMQKKSLNQPKIW